ncbi:MAG TPA: glucoamylase family protein [Rhodanobacter sp.]|nr:glucoamylase family protein [Rhodanobacter sp.]
MTQLSTLTDEALLDRLQHAAFDYFVQNMNPHNGLVADTSRDNSPVSIAVVGFALSSYTAAVERGWMERADAVRRSLAALRFFRDSDQSGSPTATGFKGFYYHFLDIHTGARVWQSELSMIDTALLIAGVLTAGTYFTADTPDEAELRELADFLYLRIDWQWAQDDGDTIKQGWKPESGFLNYGWEGYSEAIVLYTLALGSPTHPIKGDCYIAWTATYQWENLYDHDYLYAGPLFVHQFSHAWIDLRGIRDSFMREKDFDYFENSRNAVFIQRRYAQLNPHEFAGYGENCWGLSAGDGPTDEQLDVFNEERRLFGYAARGVPYGPDDGTLSPSAVLASLPFAPELVLEAVRNMLMRYPQMLTDDRLSSGFNPTVGASDEQPWVSAGHYGLDQGIVFMMIENHRSQFIWQLMHGCRYISDGLQRAGFEGGWLRQSHPEGAR